MKPPCRYAEDHLVLQQVVKTAEQVASRGERFRR
jgi:hypothetical protein